MTDEPPFKVGQRVRTTPGERTRRPNRKSYVGTVTRCKRKAAGSLFPGWWVSIRRDGMKSEIRIIVNDGKLPSWEPVPDIDLSIDDVAVALAHAALVGDNAAALALADRVIELCR